MNIEISSWRMQAWAKLSSAVLPPKIKKQVSKNILETELELKNYYQLSKEDLKQVFITKVVASVPVGKYRDKVIHVLNAIR